MGHVVSSGFGVQDVAASNIHLVTGLLDVTWSYCMAGSGFIDSRSERMRVEIAAELDFERLDLNRFIR